MSQKPKTVLIVDDDEGMRETLTAMLRRDYRVLRAATGEFALQVIEKEDVDLMLLDDSHPFPELCGPDGCHIATGSGANHHDIVRIGRHNRLV